MKLIIQLFFALLLVSACGKINSKAKQTIGKSGEVVGKSATELVDGIVSGIDKSLACELTLSEQLELAGLSTGVFTIEHQEKGENNVLTVYFIFDKDFDQFIQIKSFNKEGKETGRVNKELKGVKGSAGYYEFLFDSRTVINSKSKITIE